MEQEQGTDRAKSFLQGLSRKQAFVGIASLFLIASGTATVLNYFGTVQGTATVSQAIQVNGISWDDTQIENTIDTSQTSGDYFYADLNNQDSNTKYMTLTTQQDEDTDVELISKYKEGQQSYEDSKDGLTTHNTVYRIPDYDTSNDVVVDADEDATDGDNEYVSIQNAIDKEVGSGDDVTIYVEPGTYSGFSISESADVAVRSTDGVEDTEIQLSDNDIDIGNQAEFELNGFKVTGTPSNANQAVHKASGGVTPTTGGTEDVVIKNNAFVSDTFQGTDKGRTVRIVGGVDSITVEDNFFVSDDDSHLSISARDSNDEIDVDVVSNTFASGEITGLFFPDGLPDGDYSEVNVENNNFVSNSDSGVLLGSDAGTSESNVFSSNYFNLTGTKIQGDSDYSATQGVTSPQTDSVETVPQGGELRVFQYNYLDVALADADYGFRTRIAPVR